MKKLLFLLFFIPLVFLGQQENAVVPPNFPECVNVVPEDRSCFTDKITKLITDNINLEKIRCFGLSGNQKFRINFNVNKTGDITDLNVEPNYYVVKKEIKRIFELAPKIIPATKEGKVGSYSVQMPLSISSVVFENIQHNTIEGGEYYNSWEECVFPEVSFSVRIPNNYWTNGGGFSELGLVKPDLEVNIVPKNSKNKSPSNLLNPRINIKVTSSTFFKKLVESILITNPDKQEIISLSKSADLSEKKYEELKQIFSSDIILYDENAKFRSVLTNPSEKSGYLSFFLDNSEGTKYAWNQKSGFVTKEYFVVVNGYLLEFTLFYDGNKIPKKINNIFNEVISSLIILDY